LIFDDGLSDIAGRLNPRSKESQEKLEHLTKARYGDRDLEPETFPHLHPWGFGGWYYGCLIMHTVKRVCSTLGDGLLVISFILSSDMIGLQK
jgi:hypothetical protein